MNSIFVVFLFISIELIHPNLVLTSAERIVGARKIGLTEDEIKQLMPLKDIWYWTTPKQKRVFLVSIVCVYFLLIKMKFLVNTLVEELPMFVYTACFFSNVFSSMSE